MRGLAAVRCCANRTLTCVLLAAATGGSRGAAAANQLSLQLGACTEPAAQWSWDAVTHLIAPAGAGTADKARTCLTARWLGTSIAGDDLVLAACNASDPKQQWASRHGTVTLLGTPTQGWVSEVDTNLGRRVYLYNLGANPQPGPVHDPYCVSKHNCAFSFGEGQFRNPAHNCAAMVASPPPPPPAPPPPPKGPAMPTCAPGSPVAGERFCEPSLSFQDRASSLIPYLEPGGNTALGFRTCSHFSTQERHADPPGLGQAMALVGNLTLPEKLDFWTVNTMAKNLPRLNIKGFRWDWPCPPSPFSRPSNVTMERGRQQNDSKMARC